MASFVVPVIACAGLYALGGYLYRLGDRAGDLAIAVALLASASLVLSPAQYPMAALAAPLVDHLLAAADAAVGVHVPTLAAWTGGRPWLAGLLAGAYFSLLPQLVVIPAVLVWYGRRDRLREYVFHFHVCATVTVAALAWLPAECAFQYYGFEPLLDQRRFIAQFAAARAGTLPPIAYGDLEGLVSVPSFHAAGGFICAWAVRGLPVAAWVIALNTTLIAATVMTGAHYASDLAATGVLVAATLGAWRAAERRLPRV